MDNYNENEINIDIGLILVKLCNFKTIRNIIILGAVCGICAFSFSKFCIPEQFTSQVYMYVNNNAIVTTGGKVEINDINASQKIVESCIVILKDNVVMEEIGNMLLENYNINEINKAFTTETDKDGKIYIPVSEISRTINLSGVNETEVLNVSVTTKSPEISLAVCEYVADIAPEMVKRVIDGGRIEAIGAPRLPESKSSPNNTKNCMVGVFTGVFVSLAYYILKILLDNKIKNSEEFNQRYDIPVFAEIPLYKNSGFTGKKRGKSADNNLPDAESFPVVEAYNSLCSNILFSCRANDCKVIIVSSSEAGAGKSTIACRIAESLNNIVGNVLLVDCDMRKPNIHKKLKKENKRGLSSVLNGMADFDNTVVKDKNGLSVITAGPTPSNVAEILSSKYMDEFIEKCVQKFSYVIIDTPPVNIVNDASILTKYGAGVTFVARSGITRYKDMERAAETLKLVDSKITGVVINGVTAENVYYSRYKYYSSEYSSAAKNGANKINV